MTRLDKTIEEILYIRKKIDQLNQLKAEAETELLEMMEEEGLTTFDVTIDDEAVKATAVAPERVRIDQEGLQEDLGELWEKCLSPVFDSSKLEALITIGDVDPSILDKNSTISKTKPYVKFTTKPIEKPKRKTPKKAQAKKTVKRKNVKRSKS